MLRRCEIKIFVEIEPVPTSTRVVIPVGTARTRASAAPRLDAIKRKP